ncbi:MAG: hypothetical protein SVZ03_02350 [Spirochaetota bacterium]|nr:hypothetical protein [Spirochaetota bacterium]
MNGKSLKQLQAEEKRKKEKVEKLSAQLKEEKALLAQLKRDIAVKKKEEGGAKKRSR